MNQREQKGTAIALRETGDVVDDSGIERLLKEVRPEWKSKSLIKRVKRLLGVDPSSACQRLLNAAIHDLRHKVTVAGLDVAEEAAKQFKLPPVSRSEDILEHYSTTNILKLCYRMGLLSRPEWRRLQRAYDIRRDLEHEDDEYEAGLEDCVYIFKVCVDVVLSRDPISPVKVSDFGDLVDSPEHVTPSDELLEEYDIAPVPRQVEINKMLMGRAKDDSEPDLVRQNAIEALRSLRELTKNSVLVELGQHVQRSLRRRSIEIVDMKIASAAGILPYLKQAKVRDFFDRLFQEFDKVGYSWKKHDHHDQLLDDFEDVSGFDACNEQARRKFIEWMTLCYLGEPGNYGQWGRNRSVFYSNSAAPRIRRIFREWSDAVCNDFDQIAKTKKIKAATRDQHIARRLESLRDLLDKELAKEADD